MIETRPFFDKLRSAFPFLACMYQLRAIVLWVSPFWWFVSNFIKMPSRYNPQVLSPFSYVLQTEMDFLDSFFDSDLVWKSLLIPSEVYSRSKNFKPKFRSIFLSNLVFMWRLMRLYVWYHSWYSIWSDQTPAPEMYGWKVGGGCVFVYIKLIRGETLS